MKINFNKKYLYHLIIILIYLIVCVHLLFVIDNPLSYYAFDSKNILNFLFLLFIALITLFITNYLIKYRKFKFGNVKIKRKPLFLIFYIIILISIPEEIIFRGLIYGNLQNYSTNFLLPILFSSLIFGFFHLLNGAKGLKPNLWNWKLSIMTFVAGIFLGFSYYSTNSLIYPTLMHCIFLIISYVFLNKEY